MPVNNQNNEDWHLFDLIDAMEESICFLSDTHRIFFHNTQLEEMLGIPSSEFLGQDLFEFFPENLRGQVEKAFETAREAGRVRLQTEMVSRIRTEPVPVLLRFVAYHDPNQDTTGFYAVMLDLTELSKAVETQQILTEKNRELEHLAITCPLTGIYNRRYFQLRFEEEIERAQRYKHMVSVAMLDLDHFKKVNDTYGHLVGDEVLKRVAKILRDSVRASDMVARYGGEEFVLVFPETAPAAVFPVTIRIRQRIQNCRIETASEVIKVTASIGISGYDPSGSEPAEDVVRQADEALYNAKESGRNRVLLYGHPGK